MTDQWYYRVFGEEFGPVSFEELKELALFGMISAVDEVRSSVSDPWAAASSIKQLELAETEASSAVAVAELPESSFHVNSSKPSDGQWYCKLGGQELGPLTFDEISEYAEHEQLSVDDEVKLGEQGKWRKLGSIGRLVAVIPYKAVNKKIVPTVRSKTPPIEMSVIDPPTDQRPESVVAMSSENSWATYCATFEEAKSKIAAALIARAEADFKASEEQARLQVAWATAPKVDHQWWGWTGGVEFGPVEFQQVFGLAKSGQLKPNDLIRNGQFGQFVPSANVPGLFSAVAMIAKANETLALAKSLAQYATSQVVPSSTIPEGTSNLLSIPKKAPSEGKSNSSASAIVAAAKPDSLAKSATPESAGADPYDSAVTEMSESNSRPSSPPAARSGPYAAVSSHAVAMNSSRPVVLPKPQPSRKSLRSESSWFSDMLANLKEPKAIGSLCTVALILIMFGWGYLPKSRAADIKRYQTLKQIQDEIRSKRQNPSELLALKPAALKTAKEITNAVIKQAGREDPVKQNLLWAARDELPRVLEGGVAAEAAEKNLAARLQEAAIELGLERRPAVAAIPSAQLPND